MTTGPASRGGRLQCRAQLLHLQIDFYRRGLAEGTEAEIAWHYLRRIAQHEAELARIDAAAHSGNNSSC